MPVIKILFIADTHLGFDLPFKPRIQRRRRGVDFFNNYKLVLRPAFQKKVDLVIHGGDMFYRSRIPDLLVNMAFEPLLKIADSGIPVVIVPGNHERSKIRQTLFDVHKNIFIYTKPNSFLFHIKNTEICISGFPCVRNNIRDSFNEIMNQTKWEIKSAAIRLLCMHQAIEGAQVGPVNYTFRNNHDTIRARDITEGFAAVLSGHIHRHQVLTHGLNGVPLKTKVFYPGSIERTAFAEKDEPKGYLLFEFEPDENGGRIKNYQFCHLPARPMIDFVININKLSKNELITKISKKIEQVDTDSIVRIKIKCDSNMQKSIPTIEEIRRVIPETVNIYLKLN